MFQSNSLVAVFTFICSYILCTTLCEHNISLSSGVLQIAICLFSYWGLLCFSQDKTWKLYRNFATGLCGNLLSSLYVCYSCPNGWAKLADIFFGNPLVTWENPDTTASHFLKWIWKISFFRPCLWTIFPSFTWKTQVANSTQWEFCKYQWTNIKLIQSCYLYQLQDYF